MRGVGFGLGDFEGEAGAGFAGGGGKGGVTGEDEFAGGDHGVRLGWEGCPSQ